MGRDARQTASAQRGLVHFAGHVAATTLTLGIIAPPAPACLAIAVMSWDGSCGNQFWNFTCGVMHGTSNWNTDALPTLGDNVSIPIGSPTVLVQGDDMAGSITCQTGLSISGGALEVANGGTIQNYSINSISVAGLKIDAGDITLTGNSTWMQGRVSGAGNLRNAETLSGNPQVMDTVDFINESGASTSVRSLYIAPGATVTNVAGGTFTLSPISSSAQLVVSGTGLLTNHGQFTTANGANTTIDIGCAFLQDMGSFTVTGATGALGTRFENDATFTGGFIAITDNSKLRFGDVGGVGAVYALNGLTAISGNGNAYVETPISADWRVESDLDVNLTGTDGLVLGGTYQTLTGVLKNQGKAWWQAGTIRGDVNCGLCSPEFRNEANLTIATSGVFLDTWLRNKSGATIQHNTGSVNIDDNGLIYNEGTYEHRRGTIQRAAGANFGAFDNRGTYVRPNHPNTIDEQNGAPFVLNPGSVARFEKAATSFAGQTGAGVFFLGGYMTIWDDALVRVGGGGCQSADSTIDGAGQFHIGGVGGSITFDIAEADRKLKCYLEPYDAGVYLDLGGRVGGLGELHNFRNFYWSAGTIGINGHGRIVNRMSATTSLTSAGINTGGEFINDGGYDDTGLVKQSGTLAINGGTVTNYGDWVVLTGSSITGSGTHEFLNDAFGWFINQIPAAQLTEVSAKFNNQGLVRAESGTLNFVGQVVQRVGNSLIGGRWVVGPGATLDLPGLLTIIGPGTSIDCSGTWNDLNTVILNQGTMLIGKANFNGSITNNGVMGLDVPDGGPPVEVQNGGGDVNNTALKFVDEYVVPSLLRAGSSHGGSRGGALVPAFALHCANLNNSGVVRPGGAGAPGPFKLDGNFVQSDSGVLQIELGGTTPIAGHDQLIVDGNVPLNGTLDVRVLNGFTPVAGQQFTIITTSNGTLSGTFDQITGPGQYSLVYGHASVKLMVITPPKPGDTNGDGLVNVTDLLNVIGQWGLCPAPPASCSADLNGDGLVNVTDLLQVIGHWG